MSLRRLRSSSSSRRETPRPSPCGTRTTKRPGSEICVVSRAPFVFIGSLTAWTRMVWPREIRSWILRPWPRLELRADDLVDVEEAVLLEADLDERGLHAGQDVVDAAEVDVARDRAALGPLEVDLGDLRVLEDGDAALADVDGDEQLALRSREEARGAAARGAGAGDWSRRRSCRWESSRRCGCFAARPSPCAPCRFALGRSGRAGGGTRLLPPSPSTAAAAALRLGRIGRVRSRPRRRPGRSARAGELSGFASSSGTSGNRWSSEDFFFRKRNQGKKELLRGSARRRPRSTECARARCQ